MKEAINKINNGIEEFNKRTHKQKEIFSKIANLASKDKSKSTVFFINEPNLFKEVIENFGPILDSNKAKSDLTTQANITQYTKDIADREKDVALADREVIKAERELKDKK